MDHRLLIIQVPMQLAKFLKQFQFYTYMTSVDGFHDAVELAWSEPWYGDPMSILYQNLKNIKEALIILNKVHGNIIARVQ